MANVSLSQAPPIMNLLMALLIELVMIPNILKSPAITLLIP